MNNHSEGQGNLIYVPVVAGGAHPGGQELTQYNPALNSHHTPDHNTFDVREVLRVLKRHRWLIAGVASAFLVFAFITSIVMLPVSQANALVEIKPYAGGVNFKSIDRPDEQSREFFETQSTILKSESVARAVIDKLDLWDHPELNGEIKQRGFTSGLRQIVNIVRSRLSPPTEITDPSELSAAERAKERGILNQYRERLSVRLIRKTQLFSVGFQSFDPEFAAQVANAVSVEYVRLNDSRRFKSNEGAKTFLEGELTEVRAKLESSERDLTDFARKNRIVDIEDNTNTMATRMQELSTALSEVQTARIDAESQYEKSKSIAEIENSTEVLESTLIRDLKNNLALLQADYERNAKIYKAGYPKMVQLAAQIDDVKRSLNTEIDKIRNSVRIRYEQLVSREAKVRDALELQKELLLNLKERAIQYNILKRDWQANKDLYAGLLERIKEMGVAGGMDISNVSVVDTAAVPIKPVLPRPFKSAATGAILGLILGVALTLILAFFDNTIGNQTVLEQTLKISALGSVPMVQERDMPEGATMDLMSHQAREHEASESYRSIRTSLMYSTPDSTPKIISVTSAMAGEGKSTLALNMGVVMAQNGYKVLLIDADLRKPRLHKAFEFDPMPGLTDDLVGSSATLSVRETGITNLWLLPSGTIPPNPPEMLGARRMDEVLAIARDAFDLVIIDSPPLLGLADSAVIGTKVDGVMLVVSAGKVSKDAAVEAVRRLRDVHAPIIGGVLNRVSDRDGDYGYVNRYYYYYGDPQQIANKDQQHIA